jgi:ABC-type glycerol-3-phosphate transport system substrate-binding protein
MRRKSLTMLLILILIIISLVGCSSKSEQADNQGNNPNNNQKQEQTDLKAESATNDTNQLGRFMETKVSLPKLIDGESVVKIIGDKNNKIEVYTHVKNKYFCYVLQEDMSWKSSEPGWLNDGKLSGNSVELDSICNGEDGNYYASYVDYETGNYYHIIKSEDEGKSEKEINIPALKEGQNKDGYTQYPMIRKIDVLNNGNLVLLDLRNQNTVQIFSPEGEKLDKVPIATQDDTAYFKAYGNDIIAASQDNKSIIFYNTISKEMEKTIQYDANQGARAFTEKADGTILMGDADGIHRLTKDGTLWETTVDGDLNSMSMPTLYFDELFVKDGEEEEYFASYADTEGGFQLLHYVFDKTVSAVPANEITVYSLQENKTIRQAISIFQSNHADIKVNYVVAMGDEGGTVSDYIRALNTELLAGNGADVLVLDGLPVDSYLEKGVLSDISDTVKPMETSKELISNITGYYDSDGKIYDMPIRFSVPVLVGKKDALSSVKNIDDIVSYMEVNKECPYSSSITYKQLLQDYLALYGKNLYTNGKLDREKLSLFLENLKKIADNIKATEYAEDSGKKDIGDGFVNSDWLFSRNILGLVNNKYSTELTQVNSISMIMIPYAMIKDNDLGLSSVNQMFIPKGLIGLNSSSKETDIAKQFISFLFTEEVQNTNVFDGFPVNSKSMDKWIAQEEDGLFGSSDHDGNTVEATWPTIEDRKNFLMIIHNLKTPIEMNQVINGIIIDETLPYFTGEIGEEQAVSAAVSKINTYIAE